MKKNEETSKKNALGNLLNKASDMGRKAVDAVQAGAKNLSEKNQKKHLEQQMKKYNPLFFDEYQSETFALPNVIKIVDDAERRDIEVCEGAIGWREKIGDVEIFYLYDEFVEQSGVKFVPVAKCDEVYCVDPFDRTRFIKTDCIFDKANEEKLAELAHIAYSLGAKSCSVEIVESVSELDIKQQKMAIKKDVAASGEQSAYMKNENSRSSKTVSYFAGSDSPKVPVLKWFAHDDNIKGLIEMRCSNANSIKSKFLELKGSFSATMSQKVACAIDKLLNIKGSASLERKAIKEHSSKLVFEIEF